MERSKPPVRRKSGEPGARQGRRLRGYAGVGCGATAAGRNCRRSKIPSAVIGAMISAVDLLRSLGLYLGLGSAQRPGHHRLHRQRLRREGPLLHRGVGAPGFRFSSTSKRPTNADTRAMPTTKSRRWNASTATSSARFSKTSYAHDGQLRVLVCPDHPTPVGAENARDRTRALRRLGRRHCFKRTGVQREQGELMFEDLH